MNKLWKLVVRDTLNWTEIYLMVKLYTIYRETMWLKKNVKIETKMLGTPTQVSTCCRYIQHTPHKWIQWCGSKKQRSSMKREKMVIWRSKKNNNNKKQFLSTLLQFSYRYLNTSCNNKVLLCLILLILWSEILLFFYKIALLASFNVFYT